MKMTKPKGGLLEMRTIAIFTIFYAVMSLTAHAASTKISRVWEHHFWIIDKVDLNIRVLHFPSGNMRVRARFSNGQRLLNSEPVGTIFIENDKKQVWRVKIAELVQMTKGGSTNVRFKEHDVLVPGKIVSVRGVAYESATPFEVGVGVQCDDSGTCNGNVNYEEFPERISTDTVMFVEKQGVDYCSGFKPTASSNYAAQTGTVTYCDSSTGVIGERTKGLDKPIYIPGTNQQL